MNFERFAGMASAAAIVLSFAITMWTGLWGPLWQKIGGAEILNLFVAIIGWVVTVGIGWRAFVLSQRQIALAQNQIALARDQMTIQQIQIREAQAELAQANFLRANAEVDQLGYDIDTLKTASGYLGRLVAQFPQGRLDGWTKALLHARRIGVDALSQSAASAPFGYGPRLMTVVNRLQRIGDVLFEETTMKSVPIEGAAMLWDPHIKEAIEGIGNLSSQIREEVPKREKMLLMLADRRDILADQANELAARAGKLSPERVTLLEPGEDHERAIG
ncbi:hypothetical protein ABID58_006350 [Bradyrhizobium sp. S3.2.6]|uniref:hypothetical protein n=1 Tax=Bradyrhizobium sp. S3.2.6 TaxID=3156428 RepID=UPI003393B1D2